MVTRELKDTETLAALVCEKLTRCDDNQRETIEKGLQGKKDFVYIRKRATPAEAQRVAARKLPGVGFMKREPALLPEPRTRARRCIGFVDAKNHGVGGLELVHNKLVKGTGGTLIVQQDAAAARARGARAPGADGRRRRSNSPSTRGCSSSPSANCARPWRNTARSAAPS